jgi:hypothetical protein
MNELVDEVPGSQFRELAAELGVEVLAPVVQETAEGEVFDREAFLALRHEFGAAAGGWAKSREAAGLWKL